MVAHLVTTSRTGTTQGARQRQVAWMTLFVERNDLQHAEWLSEQKAKADSELKRMGLRAAASRTPSKKQKVEPQQDVGEQMESGLFRRSVTVKIVNPDKFGIALPVFGIE